MSLGLLRNSSALGRLILAVCVLFTVGPPAGASRIVSLPASAPLNSNDETPSEQQEEQSSSKTETDGSVPGRSHGRFNPHAIRRLLPLPLTLPSSRPSQVAHTSFSHPADALRNGLGTHYRC